MEHTINTEMKKVVKTFEEEVIKNVTLHVSVEELQHLVYAMGKHTGGYSLYSNLKEVLNKTIRGGK